MVIPGCVPLLGRGTPTPWYALCDRRALQEQYTCLRLIMQVPVAWYGCTIARFCYRDIRLASGNRAHDRSQGAHFEPLTLIS